MKGEREEEENNSSNPYLLPPDPPPCSVRPPSRCATAMPHIASFLTPKAGNFNCKSLFETYMGLLILCYDGRQGSEIKGNEVIEKIQCYKKWDLCVQEVISVMQAGGISHR